jgi:hypothetical protein
VIDVQAFEVLAFFKRGWEGFMGHDDVEQSFGDAATDESE